MAVKQCFKSRVISCRYIFSQTFIDANGKERKSKSYGKVAPFTHYRYLTDVKDEIDELNELIASGHDMIYRDDNELTIDTNKTPMDEFKARIIEEYLAQQKAALDAKGNVSTSDSGKLTPMSSADINSGASGSAGDMAGQIAMLKASAAK